MATDSDNTDKKGWKRISSKQDDFSQLHRGKFLNFKKECYVSTVEGLFQMLPEASPSIGYKLVESSQGTQKILNEGQKITEQEALMIMFTAMQGTSAEEQE